MYYFLKRVIDIVLSVSALIILSPLLVIIVFILLTTGENKVFYLQQRLGLNNKKFKIIKFATMLKNSPNIGSGSLTLRDDPRVLPFGKLLRKSKINELPQILNVIIGQMSIVGPRPQMQVDFDKFPKSKRDLVFLSKPGITGLGSIIFRDEEKWISDYSGNKHEFYKNKIAPYKVDLEVWYLNNKSILIDLKIIFLTAWVIIFPSSKMIFKLLSNIPTKPQHFY